jgi:hypothetical protein
MTPLKIVFFRDDILQHVILMIERRVRLDISNIKLFYVVNTKEYSIHYISTTKNFMLN